MGHFKRNRDGSLKDLNQQAFDKLSGMLAAGVGTSKHKAAKTEGTDDKIYSYNTYKTYRRCCKKFIVWVRKHYPNCRRLEDARKYVGEWLQSRVDEVDENGEPRYSAYTIQTEAKAVGKLFGIHPDDPDYFQAPKRERQNIKRSRGPAKRDKHFSELNNAELVAFCRGTGCRRNVMEKLEGRDLISRDDLIAQRDALLARTWLSEGEKKHLQVVMDALENFGDRFEYYIHHRTDKGGRERYSPIIGPDADKIVERMKRTGENEKVWKSVNSNADIHSYRGEYATEIYREYARPIEDIPYDKVNKGTGKPYQSQVYTCRKDEKGKKMDKAAMEKASKALGHNRIEIVANNYIRGL